MGSKMGSIAHSIPLNNLGPIIFINHILCILITNFQNNTLLALQNFTQDIGHKYDCQHNTWTQCLFNGGHRLRRWPNNKITVGQRKYYTEWVLY